jgi:uncharacterized repeat protein (TIGR01451 family)
MFTLRNTAVVMVILAGLLALGGVRANPVTFNFSGVINDAPPDALNNGTFYVGQQFSGSYTFESNTVGTPVSPLTPEHVSYPGAVVGATLNVGSYSATFDQSLGLDAISVGNDYPLLFPPGVLFDFYRPTAGVSGPSLGGIPPYFLVLGFEDENGMTLSSTALPTSALAISAFSVRTMQLTFQVPGTSSANYSIRGDILSLVQADGADLVVTMTDSPDPVKKGSRLTYTVVVSNGGPQDATGVALSVVLPANIVFESRTADQGTCSGTATVNCVLGSIASGSSATVTIKIKPMSTNTTQSTASVTGSPADPNGASNLVTITTTVKK